MIRRGTFHSVDELERAIYPWLATWNDAPKPFDWHATTDVILERVRRCKRHTALKANVDRFVNRVVR
jgi:hypothetical protein